MSHGEAPLLAFGRNNVTPYRHVGMFHNTGCQTFILMQSESLPVLSEACRPVSQAVLVTWCHWTKSLVTSVVHFMPTPSTLDENKLQDDVF
jgi:hypothetical protein